MKRWQVQRRQKKPTIPNDVEITSILTSQTFCNPL
jgi:hypothetical protein